MYLFQKSEKASFSANLSRIGGEFELKFGGEKYIEVMLISN